MTIALKYPDLHAQPTLYLLPAPPSYKAYKASESISFRWLHTGASVLAQIMPLAAAAGTPMPGMQESPQAYSPGTGVCGPGKLPLRAEMAGP